MVLSSIGAIEKSASHSNCYLVVIPLSLTAFNIFSWASMFCSFDLL